MLLRGRSGVQVVLGVPSGTECMMLIETERQANVDTREALNRQVEQVENDLKKLEAARAASTSWTNLLFATGIGCVIGLTVYMIYVKNKLKRK